MTSPPASGPITQAVPTGWRARVDPRPAFARVRSSAIPILQIVVAATAAYSFAHYVLGHPSPLLAATVTVGSLGLVRDARPRGVLETVLGMLVGIVVAELLVLAAGSGWWQIGLSLGADARHRAIPLGAGGLRHRRRHPVRHRHGRPIAGSVPAGSTTGSSAASPPSS